MDPLLLSFSRMVLGFLREWRYDHTLKITEGGPMATTERVTVTLPVELVESIDRFERNRSRFIAEAVAHELVRRRRDGLLRSLKNPHPEAAELAERTDPRS
jgi:hypothetical protein